MEFNCNNYVRVKLTDLGRRIHMKRHVDLAETIWQRSKMHQPYTVPKEDEDGWSEWQLWDLMRTFGPHMSMGTDQPFNLTIEIVDKKVI